MTSPLAELAPESRRSLAAAVSAGRLGPPFTELAVARYVGVAAASAVSAELERLCVLGLTPALLIELLAIADSAASKSKHVTLVWSGPEHTGSTSRDTGVVVRELFDRAERCVLVAGFAVYQGIEVFSALADRMTRVPTLDVTMCLNVERKLGDTTASAEILRHYLQRFRDENWSGDRLPAIHYDPRALLDGHERASLHAKCIVVDDEVAFVTSANFTRAAQAKNIEVGVLIDEPEFARALHHQFNALVRDGVLLRVPGT